MPSSLNTVPIKKMNRVIYLAPSHVNNDATTHPMISSLLWFLSKHFNENNC